MKRVEEKRRRSMKTFEIRALEVAFEYDSGASCTTDEERQKEHETRVADKLLTLVTHVVW